MRPKTLKILSRPTSEPITLSEAKEQLGLLADQTDFDDMLTVAIATARRVIEQRLGMTLMPTQYRATWPAGASVLYLPAPPLLYAEETYDLVVSVDGAVLSVTAYDVDSDAMPATITLSDPAAGVVSVTYYGGVLTTDELEPQIRSAALMYVEHLFNHRGVMAESGQIEVPQGFELLLASCSYSGGY